MYLLIYLLTILKLLIMREFIILKPEMQEKITTSIYSSIAEVNKSLSCSLVVDRINFFDTHVSIAVGCPLLDYVTSVEIMSLSRNISEIFIKLGCITLSPCRLVAVDFKDSVFLLAVDL